MDYGFLHRIQGQLGPVEKALFSGVELGFPKRIHLVWPRRVPGPLQEQRDTESKSLLIRYHDGLCKNALHTQRKPLPDAFALTMLRAVQEGWQAVDSAEKSSEQNPITLLP